MAEQYATAAELLRGLASRPGPLVHDDGDLAGLRDALAVAAQACEQVDQVPQERDDAELEREEALFEAVHLWSLLEQAAEAAEAAEAHIAHDDGGAWAALTLAFELRQAVETEPDALGARLLGELHAARVALRAALGLAAALHRGDSEIVRQCLATFQEASRAWQAAGTRRAVGEIGVAAQGVPR